MPRSAAQIQAGSATETLGQTVICAGGCHCGGVRFRAKVAAMAQILDCNCSICSATGYLHLIVRHQDFTLLRGADVLTAYRFGSKQAEHLFCSRCGIKSFYQPRSHPESWSVNLNCLDDRSGLTCHIRPFDGQNWEQSKAQLDTGTDVE